MKLLVLFCLLIPFATPELLSCSYSYYHNPAIGQSYYCSQTSLRADSTETVVHGMLQDHHHTPGMNKAMVATLSISLSPNLRFFPKGIENFFPRLRSIIITETGLTALTTSNLQPFPTLEHFAATNNNLTTLDSGLFQFNPKLKSLEFFENQLNSISADIFDPIEDLNKALFGENVCLNIDGYDKAGVQSVKQEIIANCQNGFARVTTSKNILSGSNQEFGGAKAEKTTDANNDEGSSQETSGQSSQCTVMMSKLFEIFSEFQLETRNKLSLMHADVNAINSVH